MIHMISILMINMMVMSHKICTLMVHIFVKVLMKAKT